MYYHDVGFHDTKIGSSYGISNKHTCERLPLFYWPCNMICVMSVARWYVFKTLLITMVPTESPDSKPYHLITVYNTYFPLLGQASYQIWAVVPTRVQRWLGASHTPQIPFVQISTQCFPSPWSSSYIQYSCSPRHPRRPHLFCSQLGKYS